MTSGRAGAKGRGEERARREAKGEEGEDEGREGREWGLEEKCGSVEETAEKQGRLKTSATGPFNTKGQTTARTLLLFLSAQSLVRAPVRGGTELVTHQRSQRCGSARASCFRGREGERLKLDAFFSSLPALEQAPSRFELLVQLGDLKST